MSGHSRTRSRSPAALAVATLPSSSSMVFDDDGNTTSSVDDEEHHHYGDGAAAAPSVRSLGAHEISTDSIGATVDLDEDDVFDRTDFENSLLLDSSRRKRRVSRGPLARACPAVFGQGAADDGSGRYPFEVEGRNNAFGLHPGAAKRSIGKSKVTDDMPLGRGKGKAKYCSSSTTREMLLGSKLNVLFAAAPAALISRVAGWSPVITFTLSLLAIAPLAERLGYVTEELAEHTNQTIGGLLNATFGNATEAIISMFAIMKGRPGQPHAYLYRRIVQVSLLGSVLSNILLVLGSALLLGGYYHSKQSFNKIGANTSVGLLVLATMGIVFPGVLSATHEEASQDSILDFSRFISLFLFVMYAFYLMFQLKTHRHVFEDIVEDDDGQTEEDTGGGGMTFNTCLTWLGILTVLIAFLSEWMVDAIEGAAKESNINELFIGAIVIPIVGNAAEHASAIIFASRNKLDLALGVAVGSAIQISLSVVPFCVLLGWIIDCPLDLDFHVYETCTVFFAVVLVGFIINDGTSHWLQGLVLVTAYIMIAGGYWVHVPDSDDSPGPIPGNTPP